MLSREENELLVRVGPDRPMGDLLRRYWLPVLLADELPMKDCTPVRVRILGEDLVAFRDSEDRVGLVDAYCPHRGAPMFFGRNEEGGLRCIYHAWKFNTEGSCVDIPSCPEGETLKHKLRIKAYPAVERGGLIWAYMGPRDKQPPLPGFEWFNLPPSHRYLDKFLIHCNYLQALEGDYDPGHLFLHMTLDQNRTNQANRVTRSNLISSYYSDLRMVEDAPHGVISCNVRPADEGRKMVTMQPIMMPLFQTAGLTGPGTYASNMRIPIDDEYTWWFRLRWSYDPIPEEELNEARYGGYTYPEKIPGTNITKANKDNDYLIDRTLQRTYSVSGIKCFPLQDLCVIENQWGPVADRTREHLQSTDRIIIHMRRRLLRMIRELQAGNEPIEPSHPEYYRARVLSKLITDDSSVEETIAELKAAMLEYRSEIEDHRQGAPVRFVRPDLMQAAK